MRIIRALVAALMTFTASAPSIAAADPLPISRNLRALSPDLRALVDDAIVQSPSVRALIAQIESASDVVVYVRIAPLASMALDGRVGIVGSAGGLRYLALELACGRPRVVQLTTLGHELQHVAEIASAPEIVDGDSLAAYYRRVGIRTSPEGPTVTFETLAALTMGRRVRQELSDNADAAAVPALR